VEFVELLGEGLRWRIVLRSLRRECACRLSSFIGTGCGIDPFQGLQYSNSLLKRLYLLNESLNLLTLGRDVLGIAYARNE
jgi:hypothetical protein